MLGWLCVSISIYTMQARILLVAWWTGQCRIRSPRKFVGVHICYVCAFFRSILRCFRNPFRFSAESRNTNTHSPLFYTIFCTALFCLPIDFIVLFFFLLAKRSRFWIFLAHRRLGQKMLPFELGSNADEAKNTHKISRIICVLVSAKRGN